MYVRVCARTCVCLRVCVCVLCVCARTCVCLQHLHKRVQKNFPKKSTGDLHTLWKQVCVDVYFTHSFEHARSRACMHTVSRVLRGVDGARRRKCCRKKKVVNDVFISNNGQLRVKSNLLCRRRFEADIYSEDITCSSA